MDWQMEYTLFLKSRVDHGRKLAALSIASHQQTARTLANWYASQYKEPLTPSLLTNYDLLAFRQWSINIQRVAASTWNVRRAGLALLAEWLGDAHLMDGVALQEMQEPAIRWLDDTEYGRLVRALERLPKQAVTALEHQRAIRDRAAISLMLFAGLRVSEVAGLRRCDIEIFDRSGHVTVHNGKGGKDGKVPLSLAARRALSAWLDIHTGEPVFDITTRTIQRTVTQIGAQTGITSLSCHDLRHTFAKRTLDGKNSTDGRPVSIGIVQKMLRHKRIDTTQRYTTPSWDDMTEAVGGM